MLKCRKFRAMPIALAIGSMSIGSASAIAADTSGIEEVIVTARKTEESVQVVPVSVTALSGADLQKQTVLTVDDLKSTVPGLFISPNSQGGAPTFAIRAAKADNGTGDTVTAYIGDVPVGSTISVSKMTYDMQSISVLKGPQGTLFGASTTGGAIIFRPNMPTDKFEGYAEVGIGNWGREQFQGMVNLPVNDVFQVRLAGETVRRDGFERNNRATDTGPNGGKFNGITEYNNDKHDSLRLTLRLKPSNAFTNETEFDYFNEDDQPNQAVPVALRSRYNYFLTLAPGFTLPLPVDFARVGIAVPKYPNGLQLDPHPTWRKHKIWNFIDTANYEFNDQTAFKAVLGYQDIDLDTSEQNGATSNVGVDGRHHVEKKLWTFEPSLDWKSADGTFRNKTGLYFSLEKTKTGDAYSVLGLPFDYTGISIPTAFGLLPASVVLGPNFPAATNHVYDREFRSHAIYTQFSYDLSKELTATLGLRYTWDNGKYKDQAFKGGPALAYGNPYLGACNLTDLSGLPTVNAAGCVGYNSLKSQAPSFSFTLEDRYSERSMVYATIRGGYLAGGFNNNQNQALTGFSTIFKPEKVVDFETGVKSDWELWSRPIRTNLAVFYADYKDQQRVQNGTNSAGNLFIAVANAGSSTAYGLDLDVIYEATDNLELSAGWNHVESEYTKFNGVVNIPAPALPAGTAYAYVDLSGRPMSQTPKDMVNLSATVKWPLSSSVGTVKSTLSYFWTDKTDSHDSPTFQGPVGANGQLTAATPGLDFTQYDKIPAYDLWNFSTSWKSIMGSNFDANFWVKNLTDKKYVVYTSNQLLQFGYATYAYGNPREIGLNVRYNF